MIRKDWKIVLGMAAMAAISSCSGDDPGDRMDFDQAPMLENLSSNLILPAYSQLSNALIALDEAVIAFTTDPSNETLSGATSALKDARVSWQSCSFYQLGPAEASGLSAVLNLYPIDVNQVERNIEDGSTDLETAANADARGFGALGFLLHGSTEEEVINAVAGNENLRNYLLAVTDLMRRKSAETLEGWVASGGNYQAQFNESLGVAVGSSVGQLVNAFIQDYERNIRDAKVGIPVGIRTLGIEIPDNVEAVYAGYSRELLMESIAALQIMYEGGNGPGFDDYLEELSAVTTDNNDLSQSIDEQFGRIQAAIGQVSDPLSLAITDDKDAVLNIFVEMQALAVLMKTDMASQIGVAITFQDSDGD